MYVDEAVKQLNDKFHPKESYVDVFIFFLKFYKTYNHRGPVVLACNCPLAKISAYLDNILQLSVKRLESYVENTNQYLNVSNSFSFVGEGQPLFTTDIYLYQIILNLVTDFFYQEEWC